MARQISVSTVTIANGASISTGLSMDAERIPLAIITPAALTTTSLSFQASDDGGNTWRPLYNEGTQYTITTVVNESRHHALARQPFEGVNLIRIVSGSTEGAQRSIKIVSGLP